METASAETLTALTKTTGMLAAVVPLAASAYFATAADDVWTVQTTVCDDAEVMGLQGSPATSTTRLLVLQNPVLSGAEHSFLPYIVRGVPFAAPPSAPEPTALVTEDLKTGGGY